MWSFFAVGAKHQQRRRCRTRFDKTIGKIFRTVGMKSFEEVLKMLTEELHAHVGLIRVGLGRYRG